MPTNSRQYRYVTRTYIGCDPRRKIQTFIFFGKIRNFIFFAIFPQLLIEFGIATEMNFESNKTSKAARPGARRGVAARSTSIETGRGVAARSTSNETRRGIAASATSDGTADFLAAIATSTATRNTVQDSRDKNNTAEHLPQVTFEICFVYFFHLSTLCQSSWLTGAHISNALHHFCIFYKETFKPNKRKRREVVRIAIAWAEWIGYTFLALIFSCINRFNLSGAAIANVTHLHSCSFRL